MAQEKNIGTGREELGSIAKNITGRWNIKNGEAQYSKETNGRVKHVEEGDVIWKHTTFKHGQDIQN